MICIKTSIPNDINNIDETILAKLTVESNEICQKK